MLSGEHPAWRKSSYSGGDQGECLEFAPGDTTVRVRDSKDVGGPVLRFSVGDGAAFVSDVSRTEVKESVA